MDVYEEFDYIYQIILSYHIERVFFSGHASGDERSGAK